MNAALAVLYAAIWLRGRDAGTRTLAAGFAATALWYLNADRLDFSSPWIDTASMRAWSGVILIGTMLKTFGVVQYLGVPRGVWRAVLGAFWLPGALLLIAVAFTPAVSHRIFHVGGLLPYLGAAVLAFHCARRQPGDGHTLLGVALLLVGSTPYVLDFAGVPVSHLKYYVGVASVLFGMVVLTVSLLRRQRALEGELGWRAQAEEQLRDANTRLEVRVNERTAHLHELIQGLETFTRSVSHDLRGPLGGMANLAHMAADALARGDTSVAQRALPAIARQCDASVRLVATMLELARLGDMKLQPVPVSMAELVQAAFDEVMLGAPADAPRPELHCGPMPAVLADPRLLRPVLVNLIGNAVKFSRGAARPRIDVEATVHGRDLAVCVRDNGVGLAADQADRIFDPFFRAHGGQFDGHGLGLSIVRRAVQTLGGQTWADPRVREGAALCFSLPGAVIETAPQPGSATADRDEGAPQDLVGLLR